MAKGSGGCWVSSVGGGSWLTPSPLQRWVGGAAGQPSSHDHDGGPVDHRFVVLGSAFVVADQPPVAQQPTEATFHHPPPGYHPEGVQLGALDGGQRDLRDRV